MFSLSEWCISYLIKEWCLVLLLEIHIRVVQTFKNPDGFIATNEWISQAKHLVLIYTQLFVILHHKTTMYIQAGVMTFPLSSHGYPLCEWCCGGVEVNPSAVSVILSMALCLQRKSFLIIEWLSVKDSTPVVRFRCDLPSTYTTDQVWAWEEAKCLADSGKVCKS